PKSPPPARVLIGKWEPLRLNAPAKYIASIVNKNPRSSVVRRIERNFHLDSSFRPQKLHSLVRHHLRAASEHRLPRRKIQNHRRQSVRVEIRISLNQSRHARRFLPT